MDADAKPEVHFWTNASVRSFAGDEDPVDAILAKARDVVMTATETGWSGPPFDPIDLAKRLGLEVVARDDLADARVLLTAKGLRIEFNPTRPRGRLRYSIAHEIAHTFFDDVAVATRHRSGSGAVENHVADDWQLELLCNVAAGELLVPSAAMPADELDKAILNINELMELRSRFDVSTEAILRRATQTTSHPITMFAAAPVTGDGVPSFRVDYVVGSASWTAPLRRGEVIASQVLGECTAVGFTASGTAAWSEDEPEIGLQAVGMPPYPGDRLPRVAGLLFKDNEPASQHVIRHVTGDASTPHGSGSRIVAHVVNDSARAWGGGGFSRALSRVHPRAAQAFRAWTIANAENLHLGNMHLVEMADGAWVASLVAQEGFGSSDRPRLRYPALKACLARLREAAQRLNATVHMPRIGTGQGGGTWPLVADEIERQLVREGVSVTVYTLPAPQGRSPDSAGRAP